MVQRRSYSPPSRDFHVAVWIRFPDPIPGVAQPLRTVSVTLVGEPGDLVVSPEPIGALYCSSSSLSRLPRKLGDAPVIEFNQVGQVFAGPAAVGASALAFQIDAIYEAYFQNYLLRFVGDLLHAQRQGM